MKQQSLFSNPHDLKTDVSKPDLLKDFISTKKPLVLKPVKRSRLDQIYLPENKGLIQTQIPLGRQFDYPDWAFPPIYRTEDKVIEVIKKSYESGRLGLDFEFDPSSGRISIIGVAVHNICAACRYTRNLGETLIRATKAGVVLVGHFVLGADKEVLEKDLDLKTPLESWDDGMIHHFLLRACLCKNPAKQEQEKGAAGFMGLSSASTLWTYLPSYKSCRGLSCQPQDYPNTKIPCPRHDVLGYCLRGDILVKLANGTCQRVDTLVNARSTEKVLCVDGSGDIVAKSICGWYKNDLNNRRLIQLSYTYAPFRTSGMVVTEDHAVLTQNGYVAAKDITSSDRISTGTLDLRKNEKYGELTGILLGDSHITETGRLTLSQSAKQLDWLQAKLGLLAGGRPKLHHETHKNTYSADLNIMPVTRYLAEIYKHDWHHFVQDNFDIASLAIWFLDDGTRKCRQGYISVASYSDEDIIFLQKVILASTGLHSKSVKTFSKGRVLKSIVFDAENFSKLSKLIAPFVPDCLAYKITSPNSFNWSLFAPFTKSFFSGAVIISSDVYPTRFSSHTKIETVYCIDVKDAHNFVTHGGVVHNCATDAWAGLMVADRAREEAVVKNIPPRVYEEHAELACNFCIAAEKRGFDIDWTHVKNLSAKMEEAKERIFLNNEPFNPRSDKQVREYFKSRGVTLADTQKETVEKELEKVISSYGVEDIEAWHNLKEDDRPELDEGHEKELAKLHLYKTLGKGTKAWFDEKFVHSDGKLHPRFIFTGTSTMRLSSSRPNMMNRAKHAAWAKEINKSFIPPPGYKWLSCDAKNLEYRVALWLSGMDVKTIGYDGFKYILDRAGDIFNKPAAIIGQTPRQVAKTTSYLTLYFGGFRLLDEWELKTARIKRDIAKGILVVFPDWKYFDKIVAFTGIRLADKLFRNHKDESRKAALELQELYFDKLPLRNFHKLATKTAEKGFCQTPWGSYLELIEGLHDDPKVCSSKLGQGIGAEYVQGKQVQYLKNANNDAIMQLQVHDDITWAVPKEWSDEQCLDFARPLFAPSHRYPELSIPWEVAVGENNLGEMRVLNHGFI